MIYDIKIERFRGIREGYLKGLTPLTVLVGPNGSGKSSILEAMLIGRTEDIEGAIRQIADKKVEVKQRARWLFWKIGSEGSAFIGANYNKDQLRARKVTLQTSRQEDIQVAVEDLIMVEGHYLSNPQVPKIEYRFFLGPIESPKKLVPEFDPIILFEPYLSQERRLEALYDEALARGKLEEVHTLLRQVLPSLQNLTLGSDSGMTRLHTNFGDRSVPAQFAGDGILALIRLSLELIMCSEGIVLIEEPETHQHYRTLQLTAKVIWAAVKRNIQVILTTHSLEFIDALIETRPEEVDLDKFSVIRTNLRSGLLITQCYSGQTVDYARTELEEDLR